VILFLIRPASVPLDIRSLFEIDSGAAVQRDEKGDDIHPSGDYSESAYVSEE
jgi:hypothetical protein